MPEPTSHQIQWVKCPYCGVLHDGVMGVEDFEAVPENGDANVCINCARVSVYDTTIEGGLRLPTPEELEVFMDDPHIRRAVAIVKAARRSIQRKKKEAN